VMPKFSRRRGSRKHRGCAVIALLKDRLRAGTAASRRGRRRGAERAQPPMPLRRLEASARSAQRFPPPSHARCLSCSAVGRLLACGRAALAFPHCRPSRHSAVGRSRTLPPVSDLCWRHSPPSDRIAAPAFSNRHRTLGCSGAAHSACSLRPRPLRGPMNPDVRLLERPEVLRQRWGSYKLRSSASC
jgi:hypothetical protein